MASGRGAGDPVSATVYILTDLREYIPREVPDANSAEVSREGHLILRTRDYGEQAGLFKQWDHVVINPARLRDEHGRFAKRDAR
jgi:hypothetical protein